MNSDRSVDNVMVVKDLELLKMFVMIWVQFVDVLSWRKNGEHIPHWDHLLCERFRTGIFIASCVRWEVKELDLLYKTLL